MDSKFLTLDDNFSFELSFPLGLLTNGLVEVHFVDFGNTDFVFQDNIRSLRPDFLITPEQSYKFQLEGVEPTQNFWSPHHVAQFEDFALEKSFTAMIQSYSDEFEAFSVQLVSKEGESINKRFGQQTNSEVVGLSGRSGDSVRKVQAVGSTNLHVTIKSGSQSKPARGIAHALGVSMTEGSLDSTSQPISSINLKVGESLKIAVVYVLTPSEFYCHASKFISQINELSEQLTEVYSKLGPGEGVLHTLRPGCVCAALFDSDGTWYRATVEKASLH